MTGGVAGMDWDDGAVVRWYAEMLHGMAAQSRQAQLRPPFDRVALHDTRPLAGVPALEASLARVLFGLPESLLGVPIVIDPNVEVGVIELREGSEVVDRILIAELRA